MASIFATHLVAHLAIDGTNYTTSAGSSDLTSNIVDLQGYEGEVDALLVTGDNADTATIIWKIQESDSSTFADGGTDVEATAIQTAGATNTDHEMLGVHAYITKRYVRTVVDKSTANTAALAALLFIKGREFPVTQSTGTGQFMVAPNID